jgi:NADH-quinone oxidoreductase subunit N
VVISIYYYFGWIRAAFFPSWQPAPAAGQESPAPPVASIGLPIATAMVLLAAGSIVLGFYQGPLGAWLVAR